MNKKKFATKETLVQPHCEAVLKPRKDEDHLIGEVNLAGFLAPNLPDLTDGHWTNFEPPADPEMAFDPQQSLNDGEDTDWCISFSARSIDRTVHNFRYKEDFPSSVKFVAVGSKTIRGVGNSVVNVGDFYNHGGFVWERECPLNLAGTMDDAYSPNTPALVAKGLKNLDFYTFPYQFIGTPSPASQLLAIKKSPLWCTIEGIYRLDDNDRMVNSGTPYNHEVKIYDFIPGVEWHMRDSETQQDIRMDWNYKFGTVAIRQITKKKNMIKLFKLNSSPAIYFKHWSQDLLIPFGDGVLAGGDLFKSLYGIMDYSQLPIQHVDKLPFPVAVYSEKTVNN